MSEYTDEDFDYDFTWNHRVLKKTYELDGSIYEDFYIMEVQYKDGIPSSYCEPFVSAESVEQLQKVLNQMQAALSKSVLLMEDFTDTESEEEDDNA
jgi:hypothetical protein